MTNNYDPILQSVFAEARQDLDGTAFTARIVSRTRRLLYLLAAGGIAFTVILLTAAWLIFGVSLLEFAVMLSEVLTTTLIDLGEGWLALVFMPVNNIAGLFVISARVIHLGWKKVNGASFTI